MRPSREKIDAIYDLRDAAEAKVRLEAAVDETPTPAARDALLDATLDLEAKTQHAIEACHECGHAQGGDVHVSPRGESNVIDIDFRGRTADDAG